MARRKKEEGRGENGIKKSQDDAKPVGADGRNTLIGPKLLHLPAK